MLETKLPRKIIGMNRNPTVSSDGYGRNAMDEFLHGYKGALADEIRIEESQWPVTLEEDKQFVWPSQVLLHPTLTSPIDIIPNREYVNSYESLKSLNHFDQSIYSLSTIPTEAINNEVYKKQSSIHDTLKELCLACAKDGEDIARIHCYRPFFQKIDGLCDRIKQDLIHHGTVIPHVNSNGMVWAIKDLIFVSTRIINAWNIIRAYVYDPSEGLNKVRLSLAPQFMQSFSAWQETTYNFVENLMMSFLRLDVYASCKGNVLRRIECLMKLDDFMRNLAKSLTIENVKEQNSHQCGCSSCQVIAASQPIHTAMMSLSITCSEYGEKIADNHSNRPFFRKIDTLCYRTRVDLMHNDYALSNLNSQGMVWTIKEFIFATTRIINAWNIAKGYVYDSSPSLDRVRDGMSKDFVLSFTAWQESTKNFIEKLRITFLQLNDTVLIESNNSMASEVFKQMKVFKDHLQQLKSGEVFFKALFCRNYFPDFIEQTPDFKEIRSIITKLQTNGYRHVLEAVHDVRITIYQVRKYLQWNFNPSLEKAVNIFQADIHKILALKPFKQLHFDHIDGNFIPK